MPRATIKHKASPSISLAKARRVVRAAAGRLGCTVKELKRTVADASAIPSTLVKRALKDAAAEAGCTVEDVRLMIVDDGASAIKIPPATARKAKKLARSDERASIALGRTMGEFRRALKEPDRRGRKPRPYNPAERKKFLNLLRKHGSTRVAAEVCGLSQTTFLRRIKDPAVRG